MQDNPEKKQQERKAEHSTETLTTRTIVGGLWGLSGVAGQAILQLLVLMVLARHLTPSEFGIVGAAAMVVLFSRIIFEVGVGPALVQQKSVTESHLRVGFAFSLVFGLIAAYLIWSQAPNVAAFFGMDMLEMVLPIYGFVFLFRGLSVVAEALLQRELQFRTLAGIDIASYLVGYAGVGISMALLGFGVWALVGAHLGQAFLKMVGLLRFTPRVYWPKIEVKAARDLLTFGGGHALAGIASLAADNCDKIIVGKFLGASALGIYGRSHQLIVMPAHLIGRAVDQILFPAMSKLQTDKETLARNYRRGLSVMALLTIPATVILVVLAQEIIFVILGEKWGHVVLPFQFMACGLTLRMGYKVTDALTKAAGAVYKRAWRQAVYAVVVVGLAIIGAPWGVAGVAAAIFVAVLCNYLLMVSLGCRLTGLRWKDVRCANLPGLYAGAVATVITVGMAAMLRHAGVSSVVILLVVTGLTVIVLSVVARFGKARFLGKDGEWFIYRFSESLPAGAKRAVVRVFDLSPARGGANPPRL